MVRLLAERDPGLVVATSATTRDPRPGEVDGVDYHFVTDEEFDRMVAEDEFLEWAPVFGRRYGTLASTVEVDLAVGRDVLLEIDVQGARAVRQRMPGAVLVFIEPPSEAELHRRLMSRGTEEDNEVARRLTAAADEMARAGEFDHRVVNDDLGRAVDQVLAIIEGTRVPAHHDPGKEPS